MRLQLKRRRRRKRFGNVDSQYPSVPTSPLRVVSLKVNLDLLSYTSNDMIEKPQTYHSLKFGGIPNLCHRFPNYISSYNSKHQYGYECESH